MNVFIVHAHPEPASFCSALANVAEQRLSEQGHQVQVADLYAMDFQPVARSSDFTSRQRPDYLVYALEQRHATQSETLAPDIQVELNKLLWCDLLILNFPIFWFSVPAIMKGWFDRVLVSGVAYGGKRFYDQGGLAGRRALVCTTLGGQRHMVSGNGIHGPLEEMLRPLLRGTLAYTGMAVLPPFVAHHVPYVSHQERERMLAEYASCLDRLDTLTPLRFPRMASFDERLYPLPSSTSGDADANESS